MKIAKTAKLTIRMAALLLALVMLLSACGKDETSGLLSSGTASANSKTASGESNGDTASENNNSGTTTSKQPEMTSAISPQNSESPSAGSVSHPSVSSNIAQKGLHVLMGRAYTPAEKQRIESFQKTTGMQVRTTVTTEEQYSTKMVSLISNKDAPDVIYFDANDFPGFPVKVLQPLDTKIFHLNEGCWDKTYMNAYAIGGIYYGVAMPDSWNCADLNYVTYYNPKALQACGISANEMPWKQYQNKTWNWDSQRALLQKISKAGKGITPLSLQSTDLYMLSAGADFATYNGKTFTSNLGAVTADSLMAKAWSEVTDLKNARMLADWNLAEIQKGKVGLFSAIVYGMNSQSGWFDNMSGGAAQLEAVPLAGPKGYTAYTPVRPKVWGMPKGAKNPEGAASFLRYYLNTADCSKPATFYNRQFYDVFKTITATGVKKNIHYGCGINDYKTGHISSKYSYNDICSMLCRSSSRNISTVLNNCANNLKANMNSAQKDVYTIINRFS